MSVVNPLSGFLPLQMADITNVQIDDLQCFVSNYCFGIENMYGIVHHQSSMFFKLINCILYVGIQLFHFLLSDSGGI